MFKRAIFSLSIALVVPCFAFADVQKWEYATYAEDDFTSQFIAGNLKHGGKCRGDVINSLGGNVKDCSQSISALFSHIGAQGWELCQTAMPGNSLFIFKRPVTTPSEATSNPTSSTSP